MCFATCVHELRKSSSGLKFKVNLLKLRWFCSSFVSNLASSVKVLHTFTTSGLIKRDVMFRMRVSSSLARKDNIWDTNAKSSSLLTNLSRQPSFTARNVTVLELGGFLSTVFIYTVILAIATCIGFFQQLLNPPLNALHRNAREKLNFRPVVRVYSNLLPGES